MRGGRGLESRRVIERRRTFLAALSPVVVMGRGHSGTRVLTWICEYLGLDLGTDPERVTGDAEDLVFTRQIKQVARRSLDVTRTDQVREHERVRFERAAHAYFQRRGRPDGLWGWKFPETYLIAPCVHATFPRARYLHLVRDGRDLAFKHHLTDDPHRRLGRRLLRQLGALEQPHHIQAARSWAFQVRHYASFRASVPDLPVLDLAFEDLIQDPQATTALICRFLGIRFTDGARAWIREHINRGKVAQYREQDPAAVAAVESAIGETLRAYGYLPGAGTNDQIRSRPG